MSAARLRPGVDAYQANYRLNARPLAPGQTASVTHRLFAGAKVVDILRGYQDNLHISHFDNAVDWGWFWFLTRPFFWVLDHLYKLFGNFGLAILGLTVVVKIIFFPLQSASFRSMSKMKKLQPQMEALKKTHSDDPQKLQLAMMELYKREKANPAVGLRADPAHHSGVHRALQGAVRHHRNAPGAFLWLDPRPVGARSDLAAQPVRPAALSIPPPFCRTSAVPVHRDLADRDGHHPVPADQAQSRRRPIRCRRAMLTFMPLIFTFMFATFPAGLVIYYCWNNFLTVIQQIDHHEARRRRD